jgi:hypothetical protein
MVNDPWCNGSTADFGSASPGSNPSGSANAEQIKAGRFLPAFLFFDRR